MRKKLTDVCRRINIHPTHSQGSRMRTFNCCKIKRLPIFENRRQIQKHSALETTMNVFFRFFPNSFFLFQIRLISLIKLVYFTIFQNGAARRAACIDSSSNLENLSNSICKRLDLRITGIERKYVYYSKEIFVLFKRYTGHIKCSI